MQLDKFLLELSSLQNFPNLLRGSGQTAGQFLYGQSTHQSRSQSHGVTADQIYIDTSPCNVSKPKPHALGYFICCCRQTALCRTPALRGDYDTYKPCPVSSVSSSHEVENTCGMDWIGDV